MKWKTSRMRERLSWRSLFLWVAIGLAALLFGWVIYWLLDNERLDGEALSTVGTLGAAIFTAVAAMAAFGAARHSRDTARDAVEALGLAIEPNLDAEDLVIGFGSDERTEHRIVVKNLSRWAAADVQVEVKMMDGRTGSHRFEIIEPAARPNPSIEATPREVYFLIDAPNRPSPTDDPEWRGRWDGYDEILLSYSDERRSLRWQKCCRYLYSYGATDSGFTTGSSYEETLKRLR